MQFGSDNQTGASQQVLTMLTTANTGFTHGYGDDEWCNRAVRAIEQAFECEAEIFFVATGTASNSLALSCLVQPWQSILCHHHAHILQDESTAPEFFAGGARLIPISRHAGKLEKHHLTDFFTTAADEVPHTPVAAALSITQTNEAGQVYTVEEITALCAAAHGHGLHVQMDGARFANAVVANNCTPAELSWQAGVDVLSLGATKCGALVAEAVIFFKRELAESFIHRRKRTGHLVSKGRFFGAQFVGWLQDNHWLELAAHANSKAEQLADRLAPFPFIQLQWPCQANELFITLPQELADTLHRAGAEFYNWPLHALPAGAEPATDTIFARLVTSFVTSDGHIDEFCALIQDFQQTYTPQPGQ
jgi:threonine aldolase